MGIEFDPYVHCAFCSQERGRFVAVVDHLAVGVVVHRDDVVLLTERCDLLKESQIRNSRGRVVRVVEEEELCLLKDICRDGVQVRQEVVFSLQGQWVRLSARKLGPYLIDRIAGVGIEHNISGVDKSERDMCHSFLGPDQGKDLGVRVELNTLILLAPVSRRLPELIKPVVGRITVRPRVPDSLAHSLHNMRMGGQVRVSYPKVDHVDSLSLSFGFCFIDRCKKVWG